MKDSSDQRESIKETGEPQATKGISPIAKSSMQGPVDISSPKDQSGEFEITDWSDYPDGPRPEGPFRLLNEEEHDQARKLADQANANLHRADPSLDHLQIHEVKPVKFGGDPQDIDNKIALTPKEHAQYTTWWNRKQREIQG